ncbi:MAG: hypothetical protein DMF24_06130 [Verrucomicrobia bacterium]|nr:MAG: hypothetical protein DME90_03980 [Verrucomicrobiota bacterium]PYL61782.1 MAG: hypothetical protein DMF24_06130 [Verrucomicrobiota bacterium]
MNTALAELIRETIRARGPQSFAWFMQQALYHPERGYYSSGRCAIGRKGDYFTNVSVGPLFGQLLAAQFTDIWEQLARPDDFVIVEQGAHDGRFACDVLESLQKRGPEFFGALHYWIIEPFPLLRERQSQTLEPFRDKIEWRDSLQPFVGVHFCNELLDAMPVRLINNGTEKFVGVDGDKFVFVERPADENVKFNQSALEWIADTVANLQRGYIITVDYGRSGAEFHGNLQIRARHRGLDSPFEQIGYADITMGVDWSSIAHRAQSNGLRVAGFTDQHHFLTGIISESRDLMLESSAKIKRELQTLLHPEMLGRAFQVLALTKNVDPAAPKLAGFKFAGGPDAALALIDQSR